MKHTDNFPRLLFKLVLKLQLNQIFEEPKIHLKWGNHLQNKNPLSVERVRLWVPIFQHIPWFGALDQVPGLPLQIISQVWFIEEVQQFSLMASRFSKCCLISKSIYTSGVVWFEYGLFLPKLTLKFNLHHETLRERNLSVTTVFTGGNVGMWLKLDKLLGQKRRLCGKEEPEEEARTSKPMLVNCVSEKIPKASHTTAI